jgi:TolA-binding protein
LVVVVVLLEQGRADELMSDKPIEMEGVEIFSEGVWNGNAFSSEDLDTVIDAFSALALSGRVPLKLGHEGPDARDLDDPYKNPLRQLALGWVTKIYRSGKKLLADVEVPPEVHSMINKGYLRHISVELLKDVQAGTRVIPWVLDAVALLGSDQPAVGILKDLKKALKMSSSAVSLPRAGMVAFSSSRADPKIHFSGEKHNMSDNVAISELADKIAKMQVAITSLTETNQALKNENTQLKEVKASFTALEQQVNTDKVLAHRKSITDRLEAAVKSEDIQPRVRADFIKVYGVVDADQVLKVTAEQVENFIKANPNPYKKKTSTGTVVSLTRSTDDVPAGTSAETEIVLRAEAALREEGKVDFSAEDFERTVKRLFKANGSLGDRYKTSVLEAVNHPALRAQ